MITKYKVPCDHCGKESTVELDQNIHQVNEGMAAQDKKIATLYKVIREEDEKLRGILKEVQVFNKMIEGYDEFIADCEKCGFRKRGSLGQVLKIVFCPNCKEKLSLKALILPPEDPV